MGCVLVHAWLAKHSAYPYRLAWTVSNAKKKSVQK